MTVDHNTSRIRCPSHLFFPCSSFSFGSNKGKQVFGQTVQIANPKSRRRASSTILMYIYRTYCQRINLAARQVAIWSRAYVPLSYSIIQSVCLFQDCCCRILARRRSFGQHTLSSFIWCRGLCQECWRRMNQHDWCTVYESIWLTDKSGHLNADACALFVVLSFRVFNGQATVGQNSRCRILLQACRVSWNVRLCIESIGGLMVNFVIPAALSWFGCSRARVTELPIIDSFTTRRLASQTIKVATRHTTNGRHPQTIPYLASSIAPRDDVQETPLSSASVKTADEGWINSIDVLSTNQIGWQTSGHLNADSCALLVLCGVSWNVTLCIDAIGGIEG
jgi:hypothetical protein